MELVVLQLFDSGIEAAHTLEHLVMLGLVALNIFVSLLEFELEVFDDSAGIGM